MSTSQSKQSRSDRTLIGANSSTNSGLQPPAKGGGSSQLLRFSCVSIAAAIVLSGCVAEPEELTASAPLGSQGQDDAASSQTDAQEPTPEEVVEEPPATGVLGTELSSANWAVTVFAADTVAGSDQAQRIVDEGTKFVVLDISACAIPETLDFQTRDVKLVDTDGRNWTYWNIQIGAVDPNLTKVDNDIPAGECTRGWLTMVVDEVAVPATVVFTDDETSERLTWAIGSNQE